MRTAEVTICIISERLLDRPQHLPHAWGPRLSETTTTVSLPKVSNVLLKAVYHDIRTEPIQKSMPCPVPRYHNSRVENFGQLDTKKTRANLASRHNDLVLRSKSEKKAQDFEPVRQRVVCAMKCGGAPSQPSDNNHAMGVCVLFLGCVCVFFVGGGDVVGVVTPLVGGAAQAFHDDRVVELKVQLEVRGGARKRQGRTSGSRKGETNQGGAPMDMTVDEK